MNFEFHNLHFLWLLLLIPTIAFLKGRRGKKAAALIFSSTAIAHRVSRKHKSRVGKMLFLLRLLALAFLIIALARPQLGKGESVIEASGIDIVLTLDLSSSMLALDFAADDKNLTTRLDVAKKVIYEFIKKRPNDRIALIAFAGESYLVSPLTLNHDWLETNLERLRIGLINDGTAIGTAIGTSVNRLKDLQSKSRVVILLTDGMNNTGKISPIAAAEAAASFNTKVYTIAAGRGGIVPTLHLNRKGEIAKNIFNQPDIVQAEIPIDQETLAEIAEITGAKSYRASNQDQLRKIYSEIDKLEKTEVKLEHYAQYNDIFIIPLLLGLCFLGFEQLLANTRFRHLP